VSVPIQNDKNKYIQFLHQSDLIPSTSNPRSKSEAQLAIANYIGYIPNAYDYRLRDITCSGCYSYNYSAWAYALLQSSITTALNICGEAGDDAFSGSAGGCINMPGFDNNDDFDYVAALGRTLDEGIPVTLYFGKCDTVCDYVEGLAMAESIPYQSSTNFKNAQLTSTTNSIGVEVGQQKRAGGLVFFQFDSSGHMVPADQPEAAYIAINSVLGPLLKAGTKRPFYV
jgi:pimeloyl-ACP methyl ester carboxylesterase